MATQQLVTTSAPVAGVKTTGAVDVVVSGNPASRRFIEEYKEVVTAASLTDGGAAVGTKTLAMTIPAGALLPRSKLTVEAGFAGDVSAVVTIGDGSDVDRYNSGTPSVFAAAADGLEVGVPSGQQIVTGDNHPVVTITSAADITPVLAGGGQLTVSIFILPTKT